MRRVLKIAGVVVGVIVAVVLVALVFLLQGPTVLEHSDYQIDLATLRQLAYKTSEAWPVTVDAAEVKRRNMTPAFFLRGVCPRVYCSLTVAAGRLLPVAQSSLFP